MTKILLIDSDTLFLQDLDRTLSLLDLDIFTTETGFEGIEMINREHFDILITNLFIPFFDGNDVARHARLIQKKDVFIIGISEKPWLFNTGEFDRIISKLISTADLVQIVKKHASARKRRPAIRKNIAPPYDTPVEIAAAQG